MKAQEPRASVEGRLELHLDMDGLGVEGHPVVHRVRRNYTDLAWRKNYLSLADQEARSTLDDLEAFRLMRMNMAVLRSQNMARIVLRLAHRVH